jgi:hypothetical protein
MNYNQNKEVKLRVERNAYPFIPKLAKTSETMDVLASPVC